MGDIGCAPSSLEFDVLSASDSGGEFSIRTRAADSTGE
jgi:hypothetical protein